MYGWNWWIHSIICCFHFQNIYMTFAFQQCPWSPSLGKKLTILLKKHWKLLSTEEMQKLLIFLWLYKDSASTNPVLRLLPQKKIFLSCNPVFPAVLKFDVAAWFDTAEVLGEVQLLLMQGDQLIGLVFWHCCIIFPFFSCGRVSVISIEFISIPKNCIFWHGSSTDVLWFIRKPRFWIRYIRVSVVRVSSSLEEAIRRISSRKIISRIYSFLNRKMRIFIKFVNILVAGPRLKQKKRN